MANYRLPELRDSPFSQLMATLPSLLMRMKENQTAQSNKDREFLQSQRQQAQEQANLVEQRENTLAKEKKDDLDTSYKEWWDDFNSIKNPHEKRVRIQSIPDEIQHLFNITSLMTENERAKIVWDMDKELQREGERSKNRYYNSIADYNISNRGRIPEINYSASDAAYLKGLEGQLGLAIMEQDWGQAENIRGAMNKIESKYIGGISTTPTIPTPAAPALIETDEFGELFGDLGLSMGYSQEEVDALARINYNTLANITTEAKLERAIRKIYKKANKVRSFGKKQPASFGVTTQDVSTLMTKMGEKFIPSSETLMKTFKR